MISTQNASLRLKKKKSPSVYKQNVERQNVRVRKPLNMNKFIIKKRNVTGLKIGLKNLNSKLFLGEKILEQD